MRDQYLKQKEQFQKTKELSHILLHDINDLDSAANKERVHEIATEIIKIGRVKEKTPEEYIDKIRALKADPSLWVWG